jgi:predicted amidohydrolase YtcJ
MTVADLAVVGARVRTMDPARPFADALACRGGVVVAVGAEDVRRACDATTTVVDGAGSVLTPGLVDGHQHLFQGATIRRGVDLGGVRDLAELRDRLAATRAGLDPAAWLLGHGVEYELFQHAPYDLALLQGAGGPGPLLLWAFDLHSAFANEAALAIAGVTGPREFGDASRIVCGADGRPTGELREWSAMNVVIAAVPAPPAEQLRSWDVDALRAQNAVGITAQHLMDGGPDTTALLAALEADGDLTQRVWLHQYVYAHTVDDELATLVEAAQRGGALWRADGAKFMLDGVIDTGTAWLEEPDAFGDNTVPLWPDPSAYSRRVGQLHAAGLRVATHAIGDRAVRHVLDTYAALPGGGRGRHRIEHVETAPDAVIDRFAPEAVTASMQPVAMQWVQADRSDPWSARLTPEQCDHGWRVGDLSAGGALVVLGSDWPVAHFDPRLGWFAARTRRGPDAEDPRPIGASRALTGEEVLAGYTVNAWRAVGSAGGVLRPGAPADVVLWGGDPVECSPVDVLELPVLLTVVDGRIVHRAPRL